MEKIKVIINPTVDEVKTYLEKIIDFFKQKYPGFDAEYNKKEENKKNNYWNSLNDKFNLITEKNKEKKNVVFISTLQFLLFGNQNQNQPPSAMHTPTTPNSTTNNVTLSYNLEDYKSSIYSQEISNFRNCIIIILIQIFLNNNNISNKDLINTIDRIIKSSYIKKSIHVIKSLLKKGIEDEEKIFILTLFYFIYKKYQKFFIDFIRSENCEIRKEYKKILINEFQSFKYEENDVINYSNKLFEIKLSYSLLGINPKEKKINNFLETIKDKKLRAELLEVFENYYYGSNNDGSGGEGQKSEKNNFVKILIEVKNLKKNLQEVKSDVEELKKVQCNYMDDILRVINIINK